MSLSPGVHHRRNGKRLHPSPAGTPTAPVGTDRGQSLDDDPPFPGRIPSSRLAWLALAISAASVIALESLARTGIPVPNPFLLLVAVLAVVAIGGLRAGLASAAVVVAYLVYGSLSWGLPALGTRAVTGPVPTALGVTAVVAIAVLLGRLADRNRELLEAWRAAERGERERARRLTAVIATQQEVITADRDLEATMRLVARRAQELTGAAGAAVGLVEGREFVYRAATGSAASREGSRLDLDGTLSGLGVRTGEVLRADDTERDPRVDRDACRRVGARSMVVVPLRHGRALVGVLNVFSASPSAFDDDDVDTLQLVAGLLASAVARAEDQEMKQALLAQRAEAVVAFRKAKDEAQHASSAKSEFLSRMSHELRTPLNAVLGFAQLLEMGDPSPEQRESIHHIVKAGTHLLHLVNEVLDISRIEAGGLAISIEPVPVESTVRETVDLLVPLAASRGIQVSVSGRRGAPGHVLADHQRLKQVLLNLLSNAIKYNREGGSVALSWSGSGGDAVAIEVSDTGPGIAPEHLERVFQPFERVGAAAEVEGTGLGLALSKRLVALMGGSLRVRSAVGRGSTFSMELPAAEAPVTTVSLPEASARSGMEPARPPQTVLYIEDNLSNLRLVEGILTHRPEVHLLASLQGGIGLDLAFQHLPDLVLLDLNLPDVHGMDVLHRLRADPRSESMPVVVVSAEATGGQRERVLSAGATAYLTKPIDVPEFLQVVDDILDDRLRGGHRSSK